MGGVFRWLKHELVDKMMKLKIWYPFNDFRKFSINKVLIIIINEISKNNNISSSKEQTQKFYPVFSTNLL